MKRRFVVVSALLLAAAMLSVLEAQRRDRNRGSGEIAQNAPYDGRWTFARIRFEMAGFGGFGGRGEPPWMHDYPASDQHLAKIVGELTAIPVRPESHNVYTLDDPELFKFPFAYLCEPGFWVPTEPEAAGLRAYLQKGGFVMFDDFLGRDFVILEDVMARAMPELRFQDVPLEHPVWDSFFKIGEPPRWHPLQQFAREPSRYLGLFEDNDPRKRLLVIANYNNDIGEYWEFSDTGLIPIDLSNEAYKLGVNYVIYAMTH